jgi:glycosyltransferase involved in cell wall biosynthesis
MINKDLLILETYPSHESAYDGLSGLFNAVKAIGTVVPDSRSLSGEKVLVCGIAPLYEEKLSFQNTNVIFTTFESDQLPGHWVTALNRYRHCIVSHSAIREVFLSSGVHVPVSVVHNGYRRYERSDVKRKPAAHFNVGFLGIPVSRKNLYKLYNACKQLQQTTLPGLRLHIHVAAFYDWLDPAPFESMIADDMVCWTTGKFTDSEVAAWYHQLNCYIFPSSGEGWSYTPRESMYLGIPTIITDIPAHRELIQSGFYGVINTYGKEAADFNGAVHGQWDCVEMEAIKSAILDMYRRYEHYQRLAEKGAEWIAQRWRNEDIGERILELVRTL